jgi:hypothetical protein
MLTVATVLAAATVRASLPGRIVAEETGEGRPEHDEPSLGLRWRLRWIR